MGDQPPSHGQYTQEQVDEIVRNRLREQTNLLWENWVNARLAEFGQLDVRLERIEGRQQREDSARRMFFRVWGAAMVIAVPLGTVLLEHILGVHR